MQQCQALAELNLPPDKHHGMALCCVPKTNRHALFVVAIVVIELGSMEKFGLGGLVARVEKKYHSTEKETRHGTDWYIPKRMSDICSPRRTLSLCPCKYKGGSTIRNPPPPKKIKYRTMNIQCLRQSGIIDVSSKRHDGNPWHKRKADFFSKNPRDKHGSFVPWDITWA
jgi:hypothetical protein